MTAWCPIFVEEGAGWLSSGTEALSPSHPHWLVPRENTLVRRGAVWWGKLYFTRNIPQEKWIPEKSVAPIVPKPAPKRAKQPKAQPAAPSSSIPVANTEHVRQFKTFWDRRRQFYTVPVQK